MKLLNDMGVVDFIRPKGTVQRCRCGIFLCDACKCEKMLPFKKGSTQVSCGKKECRAKLSKSTGTSGARLYRRKEKIEDENGLPPSNKKSKYHSLYVIWTGMKQRCYYENGEKYKNYGAIGITVSDNWKDSFLNFFNDMSEEYFKMKKEANGERKYTPSIDRIDNKGNYSKENCQWITYSQNSAKDGTIAVEQCDFNGNVLNVFPSASDASRRITVQFGAETLKPNVAHILDCCRGGRTKHCGYVWRFASKDNLL